MTTVADPPFLPEPTEPVEWPEFNQPGGSSFPGDINPFTQPGSDKRFFPKFDFLLGRLVIMRPLQIDIVPKFEAKSPDETQERATIDLVVLDGEPLYNESQGEEPLPAIYKGMWINQSAVIGQLKGSLSLTKRQPVLGRLYRFPRKDALEKYPTRHAIEEGLARHYSSNGREPKPQFSWRLERYSDEDMNIAMRWLQSNPDFLY